MKVAIIMGSTSDLPKVEPAISILKNGRAPLKGCYSEKTGKTYDASVLLEDDGQRTGYKMVFDNG